jgi:dynein heavy chain 2
VPFKSSLDDHLSRVQDSLLLTLRKSLLGQCKLVEEYLESSMDKLDKRPHSIEEIGAAKVEWKDIHGKKSNFQATIGKAEKKKHLLLASAVGGIDTSDVVFRLSQIPSKWENFEIALEAFNEMIEEQRENLKGEIEAKVIECNQEIEKFEQRWNALKPVEVASWEDEVIQKVHESMLEWREQLNELMGRSKTLVENCTTFQMTVPQFDGTLVSSLKHSV